MMERKKTLTKKEPDPPFDFAERAREFWEAKHPEEKYESRKRNVWNMPTYLMPDPKERTPGWRPNNGDWKRCTIQLYVDNEYVGSVLVAPRHPWVLYMQTRVLHYGQGDDEL